MYKLYNDNCYMADFVGNRIAARYILYFINLTRFSRCWGADSDYDDDDNDDDDNNNINS